MIRLALRMLTGDSLKYMGVLAGMAFAAMLIAQQAAIFMGLKMQTGTFVRERGIVDLWVMDEEVRFSEDQLPVRATTLELVRGVEGVRWAVPLYKGFLRGRLPDGTRITTIVVGVDDVSLVGAPADVDAPGGVSVLRQDRAVIANVQDLDTKLLQKRTGRGTRVGDRISINDREVSIEGTYKSGPAFFWEPTLYTTYSRALSLAPPERSLLSFVLVKVNDGADVRQVQRAISKVTGLRVRTGPEFEKATADYILKNTGILINFGLAVGLGFLVGMISTGQTFFTFTLDHLRHFASLKAMGASDWLLVRMVLTQVLFVVFIGFGLGIGAATLMGLGIRQSNLAFELPWYVPVLTFASLLLIGLLTGLLSIWKVLKLEPGIVFK